MSGPRRFTDEQVREFRAQYAKYLALRNEANKFSPKSIAETYGVSMSALWDILTHASYTNVKPGE